jgi:hypothetical protein
MSTYFSIRQHNKTLNYHYKLINSDGEKYIGLVKWFHDQAKDANYGFIQHVILGDLFFHANSIADGQNKSTFHENDIVIFRAKESVKYTDKLEAFDIKYLENETDLDFLFNHFLSLLSEKNVYSDYNLIQKGVHTKINYLLEQTIDKTHITKLFRIYENYIERKFQTDLALDLEFLRVLLRICRSFFIDKYNEISDVFIEKISPELLYYLWLDNLIQHCQVDYISSIILSTSNETKKRIFNKCSIEEKSNIFFKILYTIEIIDNETKLKLTKEFLQLSKEFSGELHERILGSILKISNDLYKLNLWLEDYHEILDYENYKLYTIILSPIDQKKFIKKTLKYIHEGKIEISVDDLVNLNVVDFDTSKLVGNIDNSYLDYSTSIILNVIAELKNKTKLETRKEASLAKNRIFDIIIKQIKEPRDILQITGFFDECGGRSTATIHQEKNPQGEVTLHEVKIIRNEKNKPKNHPICDGRKAKNKETLEPILSEENIEYWWCANQKCFKPTRELHSSVEWEKYSLLDFLTILKIDFKESDLEIYLNIINKANRFLKHLKCRECNHILYPKGKTAYAFYGVSNFSCITETCSENGNEIYLSHCLNGYCEMEIDSRDSVKCKPNVADAASCGWYVCNYCHSCCNSKQLEKRKWVYDNILHKEYMCHLKGHRDLGIVSCNKCGDSMESNELNIIEYQRILNWFTNHTDKPDKIHKSGKNKFDKWWFVIKKGNETSESFKKKLTKYSQLGFKIPDLEYEKDLQLISEPIDLEKQIREILTCRTCGNILDLSNDLEKARAVKQFHNVKFLRIPVE